MRLLSFHKSVLWTVFIAILLFTPGDKFPDSKLFNIQHGDKIAHFILFLILEFLLLLDAKIKPADNFFRKYGFIAFAFIYAIITEIVQSLLTISRDGDWFDLLADAAGAICGWLIYFPFEKIRSRVLHQN
mgnify:CR=1 FL=1